MREILHTFCPVKPRLLAECLQELKEEYQIEQRAFQLEEIGQGYILRTRDLYSAYVHQLHGNRRGEKLSQAATEVLAIIAYRQPITRPDIEAIRGVDSSGTLYSLLERGLIEISGRLEAPGRPSLYSTTSQFLQHFGLNDLSELPKMEDLREKFTG
jgi:segregation and condensation protein B